MIYTISDTHFGHANIIKYCNRPFLSVEDMDEALIRNWNSIVSANDTVIHVGDFSLHNKVWKLKDYVSKLNGCKILVRGNHDQTTKKMLEAGFNEVHNSLILNGVYFQHHPLQNKEDLPDDCSMLIHGHCHNDTPLVESYWSRNVSCENVGYTPILLENVCSA